MLTPQQLAGMPRTGSLYDALLAARPDVLHYRNASPTLYLDGRFFGAGDALQRIPLVWVEEVRLLSRTEAMLRYGGLHPGPVLNVTTRDR